MFSKIFIGTFLLLTLLIASAQAGELLHDDLLLGDSLPAEVVNTALAHFGLYHLGGDYGQGNATPVEIVGQGNHRQVRIFRSPEISFLRRSSASMQVLLGNLEGVYVWIESPPVQGEWHLSVSRLEMDGTSTEIYGVELKPGIRYYVHVVPHTRVNCLITTKTKAIKYNKRFVFTVSPLDGWARWPEFLPVPYRTIF
ncbi:MAG: hypothetical protein ACOZF2_12245 [Thermodesulfobacteriota bacterium]